MRPMIGLLIILVSTFFTPAVAQDFEGIVTIASSEMEDGKMELTVRGGQVLMKLVESKEAVPVVMLSDKKTSTITMFTEKDGKKYAIKMGPEMMKMAKQEFDNTKSKGSGPQITVTKEKKKIDGYNCFKVIAKDKETQATAWVTKDLNMSTFDLLPDFVKEAGSSEFKGAEVKIMSEYFLMEGVSKELDTGKETEINVSVQKQKVDPALFNYSEKDYQVYDMTDMMKIMMELQENPEKMKEFEDVMKTIGNN